MEVHTFCSFQRFDTTQISDRSATGTARVPAMHQSFVTKAPKPRERPADSRANFKDPAIPRGGGQRTRGGGAKDSLQMTGALE